MQRRFLLIPPIQSHDLARTRSQGDAQHHTVAEAADGRREEVIDRGATRGDGVSIALNALRDLLRHRVKVGPLAILGANRPEWNAHLNEDGYPAKELAKCDDMRSSHLSQSHPDACPRMR